MEGRALHRDPRRQWAWVVPWLSATVASVVGQDIGAERVSAFVVGLAAGVAWQLLFRRDLASRLAVLAVVAGVGVVAMLVTRQEFVWQDMDTAGLYAVAVLLGLVYTEHYQRWRNRQAHGGSVLVD